MNPSSEWEWARRPLEGDDSVRRASHFNAVGAILRPRARHEEDGGRSAGVSGAAVSREGLTVKPRVKFRQVLSSFVKPPHGRLPFGRWSQRLRSRRRGDESDRATRSAEVVPPSASCVRYGIIGVRQNVSPPRQDRAFAPQPPIRGSPRHELLVALSSFMNSAKARTVGASSRRLG